MTFIHKSRLKSQLVSDDQSKIKQHVDTLERRYPRE